MRDLSIAQWKGLGDNLQWVRLLMGPFRKRIEKQHQLYLHTLNRQTQFLSLIISFLFLFTNEVDISATLIGQKMPLYFQKQSFSPFFFIKLSA